MHRIDTKRGRDALRPRREPYWYKLSRGRHLGLRVLPSGGAYWSAKLRDDIGRRLHTGLSEITDSFGFDQAKAAAEEWFKNAERGVSGRSEDGQLATVRLACIEYVLALRDEGRGDSAHDAHMRFRRTVYGVTADEELRITKDDGAYAPSPSVPGKRPKAMPEPHPISMLPLAKILGVRLKEWRTWDC